jgi:hypothetical protein
LSNFCEEKISGSPKSSFFQIVLFIFNFNSENNFLRVFFNLLFENDLIFFQKLYLLFSIIHQKETTEISVSMTVLSIFYA